MNSKFEIDLKFQADRISSLFNTYAVSFTYSLSPNSIILVFKKFDRFFHFKFSYSWKRELLFKFENLNNFLAVIWQSPFLIEALIKADIETLLMSDSDPTTDDLDRLFKLDPLDIEYGLAGSSKRTIYDKISFIQSVFSDVCNIEHKGFFTEMERSKLEFIVNNETVGEFFLSYKIPQEILPNLDLLCNIIVFLNLHNSLITKSIIV